MHAVTCSSCNTGTCLICSRCQSAECQTLFNELKSYHSAFPYAQLDQMSARQLMHKKLNRLRLVILEREQNVKRLELRLSELERGALSRKLKIAERSQQIDSVNRRLSQRSECLNTFLAKPDESSLPLLHPFRKLQSVARALHEERRLRCSEVFTLFPAADSLLELNTEELVKEVLLGFSVHILIIIAKIIDIPLPFPIGLGSLTSSKAIGSDSRCLEIGSFIPPRVVHLNLKRMAVFESKQKSKFIYLLAENIHFIFNYFGTMVRPHQRLDIFSMLLLAIGNDRFGDPLAKILLRNVMDVELKDERIETEQKDTSDWTLL